MLQVATAAAAAQGRLNAQDIAMLSHALRVMGLLECSSHGVFSALSGAVALLDVAALDSHAIALIARNLLPADRASRWALFSVLESASPCCWCVTLFACLPLLKIFCACSAGAVFCANTSLFLLACLHPLYSASERWRVPHGGQPVTDVSPHMYVCPAPPQQHDKRGPCCQTQCRRPGHTARGVGSAGSVSACGGAVASHAAILAVVVDSAPAAGLCRNPPGHAGMCALPACALWPRPALRNLIKLMQSWDRRRRDLLPRHLAVLSSAFVRAHVADALFLRALANILGAPMHDMYARAPAAH